MKNTDFFRFENKNDDLPFYNDNPPTLTSLQSILLLIITIGGAILFMVGQKFMPSYITPFINIIVPLGALMIFVKSGWTRLFRKIHLKDILLVFGVLIVNLILTVILGFLAQRFAGAGSNPAVNSIAANSLNDNIIFFLKTIPMLLGEELMTLIPFLAILQLSTKVLKMSRKKAVITAWIVSALIFGAIHLPTYNWNIVQAVMAISTVRLVLTYPYIKTKNIWISTFVHILNDWCLFLPTLLMSIK